MVTGDSATTARAIALESGLLLAGEVEGAGSGAVLEGPQFRKMVSLTALGLKVRRAGGTFAHVSIAAGSVMHLELHGSGTTGHAHVSPTG